MQLLKIKNYINGQYLEAQSEGEILNINPATNEPISIIPISSNADINQAVSAATAAFPAWKTMSHDARFRILNAIADQIESHAQQLAEAETNDTGKPLWLSKSIEIPRAASNFRFFATASMQFASESHYNPGQNINFTLRQALGVVACISPWNLPLYLFSWKIAPALAAGNCVVAKPSELSPTTAMLLGDLCTKAGLPPGVLNIVQGDGPTTGSALVSHPSIKAVSFTGGTATGKKISSILAPQFKKLSLELGGKNPCILFDDCDYEKTLNELVRLSCSNQGQIFLCGSRIIIQSGIYDRLKKDFVKRVEQIKIGDPLDPDTRMGSVISEQHKQKVLSYIELARQEGGKILTGGTTHTPQGRCSQGHFILPTIIEGLSPSCRTNQEEIFGPVISLIPFDTMDQAIQIANESPYGLAATIWTQDLKKAHHLAEQINTGIVWINCWLVRDLRTPFGGMNQSGLGREGGWEAMKFFTESKNVCIQYS